jgi:hypothetical protein
VAIKDLVADFGGVGDGQRQTLTATISGTTLTPSSNIFSSGDIGKAVFLNATSYIHPADGSLLTITAYNSGTHAVTLSQSSPTTQTGVSMDIVWGTDNTPALVGASGSYRAWAQSLGATLANLTVPAGRYCIAGSLPFALNVGVQNSLVSGPLNGAASCILSCLFPAELRFGSSVPVNNRGLTDSGGNSARLQTALVGASTVTLVDAATYGSRVTVGKSCIISCFDTQAGLNGGYGYPPNPFFYEHNVITGYSAGVITLQNPLANTYKSTYTQWDQGSAFAVDQGGPATIYIIADFPTSVELRDITIDSPYNQTACHSRDVVLTRVTNIGGGLYPTQNKSFFADTCVYPQILEIDKINGSVRFDDCTLRGFHIQSGSPDLLTVNRGTIDAGGVSGTAKNNVFTDVTFINSGGFAIGATSYGRTDRVTLTTCSGMDSIPRGGALSDDPPASTFYSMSGGVISFPMATNDGSRQNPARILVPGTWLTFDDKYFDQVIDTWDDGTTFFASLKNSVGTWPFTPVTRLRVHPCPDLTVRGCTGTDPGLEDFNQAPARSPMYSYSRRTYDGISNAFPPNTGAVKAGPTLIGLLTSCKINVSKAYTGTNGNLQFQPTGQFLYSTYNASTFASVSYLPAVKTNTAANRIIAPGNVQNTQSGDSGLDPGNVYMGGITDPFISANISGEASAVYPAFTVEWITDQGIPPAVPTAVRPPRFRLHAHA